jgi:hypothetical protein
MEGVITNATALVGGNTYTIIVHARDTSGFEISCSFRVEVLGSPPTNPPPLWDSDIVLYIVIFVIVFGAFLVFALRSRRSRRTRRTVTQEAAVREVTDEEWDTEVDGDRSVGRQATPTRFRCLECGVVITEQQPVCPECGTKQQRCIVCHQFIGQEELYNKCPHCNQLAHRRHLLEWIKIKGVCPYCQRRLRRKDIS